MSPPPDSAPVRHPEVASSTPSLDPVPWLRRVGRWEAVSFLVLLLVAMPLKHFAGRPGAVSVVGMLHGVLFLVFVAVWLLSLRRLPARWALLSLIASVVPAGPFWIDPKLKRFERATPEPAEAGTAV